MIFKNNKNKFNNLIVVKIEIMTYYQLDQLILSKDAIIK